VIPAHIVRSFGVGRRGIKTDKKDAEVLAQAGIRNQDLPSVYIRPAKEEARRELVSARALLIANRTRIALHLKSSLRGRLIHVAGRATPKTFTEVIRKAFISDELGVSLAQQTLLQSYDEITEQLELLDEEVAKITKNDEVCQRLMTMPGVGPQIALAVSSHLADPTRFATADDLGSYLALVPGEMTTGGKVKRTGIIHAGPGHIKALLVQAAWCRWRTRPNDPDVLWARSIAAKRGKRIAIVALARKIAVAMWAMWKTKTNFRPELAARELSKEQKDSLPSVIPGVRKAVAM
jgi:transposase